MKRNRLLLLLPLILTFALAIVPLCASAQESEGVNSGNYNIKQSFEFGYRVSDFSGNLATFRTFVYLNEGPRLLEHSLEMRSLNHQGWLFDNFSLHSFGYGGDPNAVTRLRASKNKWYNFNATFRMDRNAWDYNLLANPLNQITTAPTYPVTFSLHKMDLVRRMSDYNLTLLPQSRVRFRLGYSRNVSQGPSFTTQHEGTDAMFFQDWKTTLNAISFGVDIRMLPKTSISYDQFFYYYKGDTTVSDIPGFAPLGVPRFNTNLSNGSPVDLGVIFAGTSPCAGAITDSTVTPPIANAVCNGFQFYGRAGNVRTNYPTEQLSFQSSFIPTLDLSGRVAYTSSDSNVLDYQDLFLGLSTRSRQRVYGITGPIRNKRVSATADFAATWQPREHSNFRVQDTFHFTHFRDPGFFDSSQCSLFPLSPSTGSMLLNPAQYTGQTALPTACATVLALTGTSVSSGTPSHASSSPADILGQTYSTFLGQETRQNQVEFLYDFTRRLQGRIGWRYTRRGITISDMSALNEVFFPGTPNRGACNPATNCTLEPDGLSLRFTSGFSGDSEEFTINENVGLLGLTARPTDHLRIIYDMEMSSADKAFTRISPRHFQSYRFRTMYNPIEWFSFGFMINILEKRNNVTDVFHKEHNRSVGFTTTLEPNDRLMFDFGFDYTGIYSQTNICFNLTGTPLPPGTNTCPITSSAGPFQGISLYSDRISFGYLDVMFKPFKRVTSKLGYMITSSSGDTLILSPSAPVGPLSYNYHKPYAGLEVDLSHGITGKAAWNYYGYNEKTSSGIFTPARDFRGNIVTLSMRYAF